MANAMQPQKLRFSQAIQTPVYKNLVNNTLGDPARGARFIANITSAVAVNPALQECNPGTILAGALLGESLLLQPSPQLGQFYLVPFKSKAKRDRQGNVIEPASVKAQFVLGYKGYIQLALRTGQYKRLNVLEVKAGELSGWDPFEERFHEMHFMLIGGNKVVEGQDFLEENLPDFIPVSLAGRVHTKVVGPVHTGDYIVLSSAPGVGRAVGSCESYPANKIVGYACEGDNRTDLRLVKVRVGGV